MTHPLNLKNMTNSEDYFKGEDNIHYRLLKNIALNVELLYNDNDKEISEYDIQSFMSLFLRHNLKNTKFVIHRESFGKFDCAIAEKETNKPVILYELKTFLKEKEKLNTLTSYTQIFKDLNKITRKLNNCIDSRGFFVLTCKKSEIEQNKNAFVSDLKFVVNHKENKRTWTEYKSKNGITFKIRPSRKVEIERVCVMSWEVMKK